MARLLAVGGTLVVVVLACVLWARTQLSFTRDVQQEGRYVRMRVHLARDGRPLEVDVVASCGLRITRYKDGSSSIDTLGFFPWRYAVAVEGGHAVEVRLPMIACNGATSANGRIAANFLPMVIWYDRVDDFSLGTLYATEDAYKNGLSQFKFRGAEVEAATREQFEHWLANAPANLIPRPYAQSLGGIGSGQVPPVYSDELGADPKIYNREFGPPVDCYAVTRIRLPEEIRPDLREDWPSTRPEYWLPLEARADTISKRIHNYKLPNGDPLLFDGHTRRWYTSTSDPGMLPTREGRAGHGDGAIYPLRIRTAIPWISRDVVRSEEFYTDVDVTPSKLGFAYCFSGAEPYQNVLVSHYLEKPPDARLRKLYRLRVNGTMAEGLPANMFQIFAFERDEYELRFRIFR